ncbi:protocadherin gamma-B5-like [Columba livia]|uniref:Protocadherin gamma-B5-like n=1 Tax=Columba livia TaxID=8932 RepID=A0A2I0LQT4_COLLI|nr:protocadherin gamma-B5-like [Columba livia]
MPPCPLSRGREIAGRRLRAPLLTEEEREEGRSAAGSPARCGPAHSLALWLARRPGGLRVFLRCGAVLKLGKGAGGSGRERRAEGEAEGGGGELPLLVRCQRDAVEMWATGRRWAQRERALLWGVLVAAWEAAWGQLRYSIPEEMPKGSFVGDVAKDLGLQLPALAYRGVRILDKGRTQYFALHGKTGHLVTIERIDREQLCRLEDKCVMRCELLVDGEMNIYGIEVEITDINDNAPSFKEVEQEEKISETTAPGSRFPLLKAQDPDSGRNSVQSYELSGDEHFSLAVQTGPGGDQRPELVLAKALDREEAAFHELVLRASDGGEPARTGTARIRVAVLDANDNAPVFSQAEYTVRVPEDVPVGSTLVTVTATDPDEGLSGHLKYSLKKVSDIELGNFHLDSETGAITLVRSLDFEESDSYEMEVQARDGGGLSNTAKVEITVTDVNDNVPELTVSSVQSEISEDAPSGTIVALLHVQDRDSGVNGEVRCSITDSLPFHLERSFENYYRVVTTRELDREQVSEYNVTVRAADGREYPSEKQSMEARPTAQGRAAAGRVALLAVLLLPVCCRELPERLRYTIPEELGRGSLVGPLARDLGLSPADLPARKLRLSADKQYFTVNGENGNLYVSERVDREEMCGEAASCSVSFEALVQNPLNVFLVEVAIQDVNDNAPHFLRDSFLLEINEFTSPGARFALGKAQDADVGSNSLQGYELEANGYFAVEVKESPDGSKFAELVLRRALDREREPSLRLVLTALDGGDPPRSGTAQLCINVTDANDNAPVFAQDRYRASLREDAPPGSTVLNVSASDSDAGTYARITYGFGETPAKVLQKFVLDAESGTITLQEALDFEDTRGYALLVEARDGGGLVAHCEVDVEVLDVNDNAPEVTLTSVSTPVPEDAPAGTVVALVKVQDRDSGENAEVSFELSGEAPLSLVASSGGSYKVVTVRALDREQAAEHRVKVVARDRGRPSLSSSTALVLEVSDVNDNAPVFEEAAYSAYVAENNAAGAPVLRVLARDADAGVNGRVSYWLAGGSADAGAYVSVEARSGALYAQRSFDYEQCRELAVVVRAQDGGEPARSSTATVRVFVLDRNDNAPRVLWPAPEAGERVPGSAPALEPFEVVPRSAEAGYLVAKVVAVDADAGRNAWLSYELVQAAEPALFRVGLHSGEVRTARAVSERDAAKQRIRKSRIIQINLDDGAEK